MSVERIRSILIEGIGPVSRDWLNGTLPKELDWILRSDWLSGVSMKELDWTSSSPLLRYSMILFSVVLFSYVAFYPFLKMLLRHVLTMKGFL